MKKFRSFITAIAVMIGLVVSTLALVTFTAPAASATESEEPPSCSTVEVGEGTGKCADVVGSESHSSSSSESKAVSVNGVDINSRVTVLARIRANGTPAAQQTNCFRTKRPMSLWTSYNAEGTTGWHWKSYPKGKRFCRINGAVRDPICHNQVKIGVPKSKPPKNAIRGEVKFVKRLSWKVEAVAKADEKVTSLAKAWCTTQAAYAYGEGRASAAAYAVGRGSARGSVLVKVHAQARSQAAGDLALQLGGRSIVQVKADVRSKAFASATSEASAKAVCTDTPPAHDECPNIPGDQPEGYDCNPPEEEAPAPTFAQFREINDVYVSATTDHCVTVDFPDGNSGTVHWTAKYGSFATSTKAAQDMVQVCSTYKAPSEVPSSGTDTITVTATDSVTGKSVTQTTDPFVIKAMPATP